MRRKIQSLPCWLLGTKRLFPWYNLDICRINSLPLTYSYSCNFVTFVQDSQQVNFGFQFVYRVFIRMAFYISIQTVWTATLV